MAKDRPSEKPILEQAPGAPTERGAQAKAGLLAGHLRPHRRLTIREIILTSADLSSQNTQIL